MTVDPAVTAVCDLLAVDGLINEGLLPAARRVARHLMPLTDDALLESIAKEAVASLCGLGPLQHLLDDALVTEIIVNNGGEVWVEREGRTLRAGHLADDVTPRIIERVLSPLGRRLDRLSPIVDARLADGSRLCAVIPPIALDGPCFTLRRFGVGRRPLTDFADPLAVALLHEIVDQHSNLIISGATSSGKTSLLNALASRVADGERLITLEDTAELQLDAAHVLRLESRAGTADGVPPITMTDLVRASLRLRPDRIVLGEVRGGEVLDMLQAFNTGHDGSMATCHANGPLDALRRIEALVVQHAPGWPVEAVREHVCSSIDVVVHVERGTDGRRHVCDIIELASPQSAQPHRVLVAEGVVVSDLTRRRRS